MRVSTVLLSFLISYTDIVEPRDNGENEGQHFDKSQFKSSLNKSQVLRLFTVLSFVFPTVSRFDDVRLPPARQCPHFN